MYINNVEDRLISIQTAKSLMELLEIHYVLEQKSKFNSDEIAITDDLLKSCEIFVSIGEKSMCNTQGFYFSMWNEEDRKKLKIAGTLNHKTRYKELLTREIRLGVYNILEKELSDISWGDI